MLKNVIAFILFITITLIILASGKEGAGKLTKMEVKDQGPDTSVMNMTVQEALLLLGEEPPLHYIPELDLDSAQMGMEMVYYGGLCDGSIERISKFFVCTDCHNQVPETDDLSDESPERVLKYGMENQIPFLPAASFYGMYNKRHWYNGDYEIKYGELVKPTRDTLVNAIQLCAIECSQGRPMEPWEIRCVLHYYKSIELRIKDLTFDKKMYDDFTTAVVFNNEKALEILHSRYNEINPATFGTSEIPVIEGYQPSMENGAYIYKYGCLACHAPGKEMTNFTLSMNKLDFIFLANKKEKYNHFSIPHITRYGTYAISGRRQYMPMYTMENMSDKQLLDLIYYVEQKAEE